VRKELDHDSSQMSRYVRGASWPNLLRAALLQPDTGLAVHPGARSRATLSLEEPFQTAKGPGRILGAGVGGEIADIRGGITEGREARQVRPAAAASSKALGIHTHDGHSRL
jgi:hypothetical protein